MPTQHKVAIASDHAGFGLKSELVTLLTEQGHTVIDLGTGNDADSVDYPDFGRAVAQAVTSGDAAFGVAVCGTGIGISIAANRLSGCRAALCHDVTTARLSRQHNDANVLALGARVIGPAVARECLEAFLDTGFEGGRHQRRLDKL
ncbi:ribose 5-phosphate isomerase B [Fodinicurvata sp. EGI_FJ10296]|jgi:ribose 5-phosphate isomerase B|uniref:ribose 5-phosphate isomerase B n=1 Tax=Fodinicurvata sp. EGI_FJ10296 TaxID=3231908 RepID=UPI0034551714